MSLFLNSLYMLIEKITLNDIFDVKNNIKNSKYSRGEVQVFISILSGAYNTFSSDEAMRVAEEDRDVIDGKIIL